MNKKAFTLIELLIVVLILGILAAFAYPQYEKAVQKAQLMKVVPMGRRVSDEAMAFFLANARYPTLEDLSVITIPQGVDLDCASGAAEDGAPSTCDIVSVSSDKVQGVWLWFAAGSHVFDESESLRGARRLCLAENHYQLKAVTHSLCRSLGGEILREGTGVDIFVW